jgi:hypothetical protein
MTGRIVVVPVGDTAATFIGLGGLDAIRGETISRTPTRPTFMVDGITIAVVTVPGTGGAELGSRSTCIVNNDLTQI